MLHIDDGIRHCEIQLDANQIQNGSILHRIGSDDIGFRLEVKGADGPVLVGTMRVLDGVTRVPAIAAAAFLPFATRAPTTRPQVAAFPTRAIPQLAEASSRRKTSAAVPNQATAPGTPVTPRGPTERTILAAPTPPSSVSASAPVPSPAMGTATASNKQLPSVPLRREIEPPKPPSPNTPSNPVPLRVEPRTTPGIVPSQAISTAKIQNVQKSLLPPRPIRQVSPDLRSMGQAFAVSVDTRIVAVVQVNSDGRVTEAHVIDTGKVPPQLAFASLSAAKQWTFNPAKSNGKKVDGFYTMEFDVHPAGR